MAAHGEPEVALSAVQSMLQEQHVELLRRLEESMLRLLESLVTTSASMHQVPPEPTTPSSHESSRSAGRHNTGFKNLPLYGRDKVDVSEARDLEEFESAHKLAEEKLNSRTEEISRTKSIITKWGGMSIEENTWQAWLYTLLSSWQFEVTLALLIFLNALFLGVQTEVSSHDGSYSSAFFFDLVSVMFTLIFMAELLLRMLAMQWAFFSVDVGWNLMDAFIVFSSTLELCMAASVSTEVGSTSAGATSGLRILRVVRVTRLLRVLRVVRVVRFIRALRTLVYSIVCTLRSLAWSMLLLVLIIYVFSILLTDAVNSHFDLKNPGEELPDQVEAELELRFGSLHRSMQTLFQCIAGGLSWAPTYLALEEISLIWAYLFLVYVSFCYFAVLNVMTGVFCHSAIQSANRDHELAMQAIWQDKERYAKTLQGIFEKMDADNNGSVNIKEFQNHFDDHEVRGLFSALELDASDAWTLFRALDANGDHEIMSQEFLDGCMVLRGFAKSIDVASFRQDSRHWYLDIMKALRHLQASCQRSEGSVNIQSIEEMQKRLKDAFQQLHSLQPPSKSDTTSTGVPTCPVEPAGFPVSNQCTEPPELDCITPAIGVSRGGELSVLV